MIKVWNDHMAAIFLAAWVICLDESMLIWHNKWTCPGWIFCPQKPHPFGNEYHTVCCTLSNIMFSIELVEGKDAPCQITKQFDCYFACCSRTSTLQGTSFLTLASVCSRPSSSCGGMVCLAAHLSKKGGTGLQGSPGMQCRTRL